MKDWRRSSFYDSSTIATIPLLPDFHDLLGFFNPAIWYFSRRLTSLREFACDGLVCTGTEASVARYAAAPVRVAELSRPRAAA